MITTPANPRPVTGRRRVRRLAQLTGVVACVLAAPAHGQSMVALSGFAAGGRQLVLLDFSMFPLGPLSRDHLDRIGMSNLTGELEVVVKDGVHMLRASEPSTFLLRLPERLPDDFTLEFDLIPKNCCNPEDLGFEGTANIRQDEGSAYVLWHRDALRVIGGVKNESYDKPMPAALSAVLPGAMTNIAASLQGRRLRMFTNGQPIYSLDRVFARGQVLRVFLGGQKRDRDEPVYLARLRIAAGPPVAVIATAAAASVTPRSAIGELSTGTASPLAGRNPAAAADASLFAPPASRTIALSGVTADGSSANIAPRAIDLAGITATGVFNSIAPRLIVLARIQATGTFSSIAPRVIVLTEIQATGAARTLRRATGVPLAPPPRTITLDELLASGGSAAIPPRAIALSAIAASGVSALPLPRAITLAAVTATGGSAIPRPRTITLAAVTAAGASKTP